MRPILLIFAAFCLILLMGAGLTRLYYALVDAPWLKVQEIETAGLNKLERNEILNTMGVNRGECILNLRMGSIAERLEKIPRVKKATVRLDPPGRIVAEITERQPYALLKGNDLNIMDEGGFVYAQAAPEEYRGIPTLSGLSGPNLKVGDSLSRQNLRRVKDLLSALEKSRSWIPAGSINECQWSTTGFILVLGERGVPVDIGHDNFEVKLARLRQVLATLNERQWTELVTRIDLDYPGKAYLDGQFTPPKPAPGQARQAS